MEQYDRRDKLILADGPFTCDRIINAEQKPTIIAIMKILMYSISGNFKQKWTELTS